jgi:hypothetical protein
MCICYAIATPTTSANARSATRSAGPPGAAYTAACSTTPQDRRGRAGHPGGSQNITNPTFKTDIAYEELVARARDPAVVQLAAVFAADWIGEAASSL